MARPAGRRNTDFEAKRADLAERARVELMARGAGVSLRELADAMDVSVTNLKHYFGDRDGLYEAIGEAMEDRSRGIMQVVSSLDGDDAEQVAARFLDLLVMGWRQFGAGKAFVVGFGEGLGSDRRGATTVNHVLEPSLQAGERLLEKLVARGAMPSQDLRAASLALLAPVVLALFHQDGLNGVACRPLDVDAFVRAHAHRWALGYAR